MDFLPHTTEDDRAMLDALGLDALDDLFDAVPAAVRLDRPLDVPRALSEPELLEHLRELAGRSRARALRCFAGGGFYDHHVPAAVRSLATRAEFATSYTPYQAELSQGVLQALFEFQSVICEIYGMEVANASLYDGAASVVEGVNLALRVTHRDKVLVGSTVNPHYRQVLETYTSGLGVEVLTVRADESGVVDWSQADADEAGAVVAASPNFFGRLEDMAQAAECAHSAGALLVAVTDPTAMGILEAPGHLDADVAAGEGQSLGNPMSYGGPAVGLFATKLDHVRQVPGRIAGETTDADGRRGYVLTLQAREQHIRRARATSNVCTNQTLLAIAAGIYLSWLGPQGLRRLGEICARRTAYAAARLAEVPGLTLRFDGPRFKEVVVETAAPAAQIIAALAARGFLVGPDLGRWYPGLRKCLLVAVTERRTAEHIDELAEAFGKELAER
ncbi:MAG TPA: aminomethyl-transferring glycine dehydrogenase subunit GcvPA [Actinomycetota bacterium]|nr:aminomethyl-transferring glycine dehydrogenase subunit GcvPA [Actinomycetota bacterium]